MGGFTFAGEYNTADYANGGSGDGFLPMANYATGNWGFTLRYSDFDIETLLALPPSGQLSPCRPATRSARTC
jgi:hypothetical protein